MRVRNTRRFSTIGLIAVATVAAILPGAPLATADPSHASGHDTASIVRFSPARTTVGAKIRVRGVNLKRTTAVLIHGRRAVFQVNSNQLLTAVVPRHATSGRVTLESGGAKSVSAEPLAVEHPDTTSVGVTSFTPTSGPVGTVVTVVGTGFTAPCAAMFGTVAANCVDQSSGQLQVTVPVDAASAPISITTDGSTVATATAFKVSVGLTLLTTLGPPGTITTIEGSGFNANEAVDVTVGDSTPVLEHADGSGAFVDADFAIPADAQPGSLPINAVGRRSDIAAQTIYTVRTDWNNSGFSDNNTRDNRFENTLDVGNVPDLGRDWGFATGAAVYSQPVVSGGVAYVGTQSGVAWAINAATGSGIWDAPLNSSIVGSLSYSPSTNMVYALTSDGTLYGLNATSGTVVWTEDPSSVWGGFEAGLGDGLVVTDGLVYVDGGDALIAYKDTNSSSAAAQVWADGTFVGGTGSGAQYFANGPAAINDGIAYVSSQSAGGGEDFSRIFAFNAATGKFIFNSATVPGSSYQCSSPTVTDGYVMASCAGTVDMWNFANGDLWATLDCGAANGESSSCQIAVADGELYAVSSNGDVYAYDIATQALDWTSTPNLGSYSSESIGFEPSPPVVANGVIYLCTYGDYGSAGIHGSVLGLNSYDGSTLWREDTGGLLEASPTVVNGTVYVGAGDSNLYAFDLAGGSADRPGTGSGDALRRAV